MTPDQLARVRQLVDSAHGEVFDAIRALLTAYDAAVGVAGAHRWMVVDEDNAPSMVGDLTISNPVVGVWEDGMYGIAFFTHGGQWIVAGQLDNAPSYYMPLPPPPTT